MSTIIMTLCALPLAVLATGPTRPPLASGAVCNNSAIP